MTSIEISRGFEAPVGRRDAAWAKGMVVPRDLAALRRLGLLVAVGVGVWTTALVVTTPALRIGAQHAELHAQIATAGALVALLVALLAAGRYRRHATPGDLLLAAALALLGISNLLFTLVPAATGHTPGELSTWLPVSGRLLAAGLLAAAALAPAAAPREPARAARLLVAGTCAATAALALGLAAFGPGFASPAPGRRAYNRRICPKMRTRTCPIHLVVSETHPK